MTNNKTNNGTERISRFLDGDILDIDLSENDRKTWKLYNLISDSIKNPNQNEFIPDLSDKILKKIEQEKSIKIKEKNSFFVNLYSFFSSISNFNNFRYVAGISFVFFLGFSSSKIIESNVSDDFVQYVSPEYLTSPSENLYSCNFPELKKTSNKINLDQLIEHHEGVSGSSSLC